MGSLSSYGSNSWTWMQWSCLAGHVREERCHILQLPDELILRILSYLTNISANHFGMTNKKLQGMVEENRQSLCFTTPQRWRMWNKHLIRSNAQYILSRLFTPVSKNIREIDISYEFTKYNKNFVIGLVFEKKLDRIWGIHYIEITCKKLEVDRLKNKEDLENMLTSGRKIRINILLQSTAHKQTIEVASAPPDTEDHVSGQDEKVHQNVALQLHRQSPAYAKLRVLANGEFVAMYKKFPNLECVYIKSSMNAITKREIAQLPGCNNKLTTLALNCMHVNDDGIEILVKHAPQLARVWLAGNPVPNEQNRNILTEKGLCALAQQCSHLIAVELQNFYQVTSRGIGTLSTRKDLRFLHMENFHFDGNEILFSLNGLILQCNKLRYFKIQASYFLESYEVHEAWNAALHEHYPRLREPNGIEFHTIRHTS